MLKNRSFMYALALSGILFTSAVMAVATDAKTAILIELEKFGSRAHYDFAGLNAALRSAKERTGFDWQTWSEATKLLEEESALNFSTLKSIVENTGRIQSPGGVLSPEKEAMLYTLRALLRRKLRMTRNRLPWTFLLGQTQFFLGDRDNFYLKYYVARGKDPVQLSLARDMLAQIKP